MQLKADCAKSHHRVISEGLEIGQAASANAIEAFFSLRSLAVRFFGLVETSGKAARNRRFHSCLSPRLLAALELVIAACPLFSVLPPSYTGFAF